MAALQKERIIIATKSNKETDVYAISKQMQLPKIELVPVQNEEKCGLRIPINRSPRDFLRLCGVFLFITIILLIIIIIIININIIYIIIIFFFIKNIFF